MQKSLKFSVIMPFFERPKLLAATLSAYNQLCKSTEFEVIVVDDHSRDKLRPAIPQYLSFDVVVVSLRGEKTGINPSLPIEVGVQHARGENLILTSPEVMPVRDFFLDLQNAPQDSSKYKVFDVFAITDPTFVSHFLDSTPLPLNNLGLSNPIRDGELRALFESGLGFEGYGYQNQFGAWYQHHLIKNEMLHFLSSISRAEFHRCGGFDLGFRRGAGYEDLEFRDRILRRNSVKLIPGLSAVHLPHEEVSSRTEFRMATNSNRLRYQLSFVIPFRLRRGKKRLRETVTTVRTYQGNWMS